MRFVRVVMVVALSACYLSYVFHLSGAGLPTAGLGNWIDPYFINFLLEHWSQAIRTFSDPLSPPMYFPARGTLGYSHALILYAPFYGAVRPFLDPFQAQTLTLLLVIEIGSLSLYAIFRAFLRLGFVEALLLTACFLTSPNVINPGLAIWSQTASVFLIPPILLVALLSLRMRDGWPRPVLASVSGLFAALLFTQDIYTGLFALLVSVLLVLGLPLCARRGMGQELRELRRVAKSASLDASVPLAPAPSVWWAIVAGIGLVCAAAILLHPMERATIWRWRMSATDPTRPLLLALLTGGWFVFRRLNRAGGLTRAAHRAGRRVLAAFAAFGRSLPGQARPMNAVRHSRSWLRWSAIGGLVGMLAFAWIYLGVYLHHPEFATEQLTHALRPLEPSAWQLPSDVIRDLTAYDTRRPFLLVLLLTSLAWIPWPNVHRGMRRYSLWLLAISIVVFLLPLSFHGVSIWRTVFAHVPGLSVIRDPRRIIHVYELAVVLVAGIFLASMPTRLSKRLIAAIPFVLIVTTWNTSVFPFERSQHTFREWVEAPIAIDPACRSFFITSASDAYMSRSGHMWSLYAIDAAFIALQHSIPTLNGYSAWKPDGWDLANPQEPEYPFRVRHWIDRNALPGVCALDIERRTMTPFE